MRPAEGPGTIYLLGSVHVGQRAPRFGPAVEDAFREAEELVVEVDIESIDTETTTPIILRYGTIPPPDDLRTRLSGETWELLEPRLAELGLPEDAVLRFEPWVVAVLLTAQELARAGYQEELGVERTLLERAGPQLPVRSLETAESQLRMFAELPGDLQEMMLLEMLVRQKESQSEMADLIAAWEAGDEEALAAQVFSPLAEYPELAPFYEAVFFRRNETMAESLAALSRDGRTRLAVLGAGHMVGERGIPALLAARGFRVERVVDRR